MSFIFIVLKYMIAFGYFYYYQVFKLHYYPGFIYEKDLHF